MRVGYVIPHLGSASGWRSMAVGAIRSLSEHEGISATLYVAEADLIAAGDHLPGFPTVGLPHTQALTLRRPQYWRAALATRFGRQWTAGAGLDLVHSLDTYPTGLVGSWLARRARVPHVVSPVGTYSVVWSDLVLHRHLCRKVMETADYLCPISNGTVRAIDASFPGTRSESRTEVVLLGTDYAERVAPAAAFGRGEVLPTILSVGAVKPRKGYHISLRAFARVRERCPRAVYRIVGGLEHPGYFAELQHLILSEGIEGVEFLGAVPETTLAELFNSASVFLLTPQTIGKSFEGFGLVYIEAGAYGLPVVGTRVGGVTDAVRDGETGFLAEADDDAAVAAAVLRILEDPQLASRLGWGNRRLAEELSWKRYAAQQAGIYRRLLSAETAPAEPWPPGTGARW